MPTGVHPAGLTVGVSIYDEGAPCHQAPKPSCMLTLPQLWPTKTPDKPVRGLQMAVAKGPIGKGVCAAILATRGVPKAGVPPKTTHDR